MIGEDVKQICEYIRKHAPKETDFETIDAAIRIVTGNRAGKTEDMVNPDDAWLIPESKKGKFAGMKGKGFSESFGPEEIKMIEEAVKYAREHAHEHTSERNFDDSINKEMSIEELKQLREQIVNNNYVSKDKSIDNNNDFGNYPEENDVRNFGK